MINVKSLNESSNEAQGSQVIQSLLLKANKIMLYFVECIIVFSG